MLGLQAEFTVTTLTLNHANENIKHLGSEGNERDQ